MDYFVLTVHVEEIKVPVLDHATTLAWVNTESGPYSGDGPDLGTGRTTTERGFVWDRVLRPIAGVGVGH